ncbi:MAG TPA: ABC transporter permease [Gemmatimonadaceae bacterium]|nr:ABC transporter permease [Gemmatimonadaceae bacterium]
MNLLFQEFRYAARKLLRAPGFTAIAVLTLALGIGATTAVFSVVYNVLLKPLPYRDAGQLVSVESIRNGDPMPMSPLDFIDYRQQTRSFASMAAIDRGTINLTGVGSQPVRLRSTRVSASFFGVLGVEAVRGRLFRAGEDKPGAPRVVVLSYGTWRSEFGGDPRVIGQTVSLDGNPYSVIGVTPSWMRYPENTELWVPMQFRPDELDPGNRGAHSLDGIARLAPGVTVQAATRDLGGVAARLATAYPESNAEFGAGAYPLQAQMVQNARAALLMLMGAVAFVLLVACTNVANLLLVRASAREAEMAVRTALGASRWRIVRQLAAESILLAGMGTVAGILLAAWAVDALVAFGPHGLPRLDEVSMDGRAVLFAAVLAVVTGLLFGAAPAIHAVRSDISEMLRGGGRGANGRRHGQRTRHALVVAETALAVVLLVGAGLFLRSFARLLADDPGFKPAHVTTATVSLPANKYRLDRDASSFADRLTARVRALPGVSDVAIGFGRPLYRGHIRTAFEVAGWAPSTPNSRRLTFVRSVSPAYFKLLGIPLDSGRTFTDADRADARQVVVVNEELVRRYFRNGESPIGKHITLGWDRDTLEWGARSMVGGEIVGVVRDVTEHGPGSKVEPTVYTPFAQVPVTDITVLVQSKGTLASVARGLRAALRDVDPDLPLFDVTTMDAALAESVAEPRFYTMLLSGFAGVALLLAAIGIYGVIAYSVSLRHREIGIRLALGATRARVMRLTLGQGVVLAAAGIPVGLVVAFWLTRYVSGLLFGVGGLDPVTFGVVPLVLMGVAAVASYVPARRAARVDPVVTMRAE